MVWERGGKTWNQGVDNEPARKYSTARRKTLSTGRFVWLVKADLFRRPFFFFPNNYPKYAAESRARSMAPADLDPPPPNSHVGLGLYRVEGLGLGSG